MRERRMLVYADWLADEPIPIGELFVSEGRGRELFSFSYSEKWLRGDHATTFLDPEVHPFSGRQYAPSDKPLFGMFSDCCPDRWGRTLMQRREVVAARREGRKPKKLLESDFLAGVCDQTRMGGLRFASEDGVFLSSGQFLVVPPWTQLRALETASIAFENEEDPEEEKWLAQLLVPGSSLGGARPKASVTAPDGSIWIAKFPSRNDEWDMGAWEAVTNDLARRCGLNVPQAELRTFAKNGGTFLSKRFDRNGAKRIHFASAMTMLGRTDGEHEASYLDIARFIQEHGADPGRDMRELWARIVFNIAVSNTDDHLRNHGFLLTSSGWRLAPAYDVNPNIYGESLSLNIDFEENALDFELAMGTAGFYGIPLREAKARLTDICETVEHAWRDAAGERGIGREAMRRMSPAFDMSYKGGRSATREAYPVSSWGGDER